MITRFVFLGVFFVLILSEMVADKCGSVNYSIQPNESAVIDSKSEVTLVVTACNRPDFLYQCIQSIFTTMDYKFNAVMVSEASGKPDVNKKLMSQYPFITQLVDKRLSQVESIDRAYANISTKYILHFEEDWIVHRGGFILPSIKALEKNSKISVVSLQRPGINEFQQIDPCCTLEPHNVMYMKEDQSGGWGYFTWGAGLRRFSDYQAIGSSYKKYDGSWKSSTQLQNEAKAIGVHIKKHFIHREWRINWLYKSMGFRVALLNDSAVDAYAQHCETAKHVPDERGFSPFE